MSTKPDYRDLIVDHPSCRAAPPAEHLDGTTYTKFDELLPSVRVGSIVRVFKPFLLGGAAGQTRTRRKTWADRADAIKDKGGKLMSIDPPLSGQKLTMLAYEQIGNVARGKAGVSKSGRRKKSYTVEERRVIEHYWPPRKNTTGIEAVEKINSLIAPKVVTRGWLYVNYPIPD